MNTKSELFPALDADLARRVLRNGLFESERLDPTALQMVSRLGLVTVTERPIVLCVYEDDPDFLERKDLDCPGEVFLEARRSRYACPECKQPINDIGRKTKFLKVDIALDLEGMKRYLRRVLKELGLAAETSSRKGRPYVGVTLARGKKVRVVLGDFDEAGDSEIGLVAALDPATGRGVPAPELELAGMLSVPAEEVSEQWRRAVALALVESDSARLLKLILGHYNDAELRDLCFKLGVPYDDLRGPGRKDKARELIAYMENRGRLALLVRQIQLERPKVDVAGILGA